MYTPPRHVGTSRTVHVGRAVQVGCVNHRTTALHVHKDKDNINNVYMYMHIMIYDIFVFVESLF
jgi:hypothetical protein